MRKRMHMAPGAASCTFSTSGRVASYTCTSACAMHTRMHAVYAHAHRKRDGSLGGYECLAECVDGIILGWGDQHRLAVVCSRVSFYPCIPVPLCSYIPVSACSCILITLHTVPLYPCIPVPLYICYIHTQQPHTGAPVPLRVCYMCTRAPAHFSVCPCPQLLHRYIHVPQHHCARPCTALYCTPVPSYLPYPPSAKARPRRGQAMLLTRRGTLGRRSTRPCR